MKSASFLAYFEHVNTEEGKLQSISPLVFVCTLNYFLNNLLTLPDPRVGGRAAPPKGSSPTTFDKDKTLKRNFG